MRARCGHDTEYPVMVGHLDVPRESHFPVCFRCVGDPDMRLAAEALFGDAIEAYKERHGPNGKARKLKAPVIPNALKNPKARAGSRASSGRKR